MQISKEALAKLKKELPRGSGKVILKMLKAKGETFCIQYIYRCLDPNKEDYNKKIIQTAVRLCRKLESQKASQEKIIRNINKPKE